MSMTSDVAIGHKQFLACIEARDVYEFRSIKARWAPARKLGNLIEARIKGRSHAEQIAVRRCIAVLAGAHRSPEALAQKLAHVLEAVEGRSEAVPA